jgi:hypothetical protein
MANEENATGQVMPREKATLPLYVPPKILTYTAEEIAEQIGPALMCSPSPCPTAD